MDGMTCLWTAGERKLLVTDSLFSMDGDWANLPGLAHLRRQHGFLLAIDDAHASLVVGPG
jgi:8-amino-7-oxononanoate synthase